MPVIFRDKGCRFFFFSNEGDPLEPLHVHVKNGEKLAKFWLDPQVSLAESYGFSAIELNRLAKVIAAHREIIERSWHEHFGH